ncbi:HD domain-containing phosphohydrolase [Clostridium sp. 'White wine YQ']|uniref:HD domain-containing phosphohydrolase n=1 Tax=Clostridium sp. 'White wine YQ' TaxID=3027474 RepID=UPI002366FA6B|nr:HD domain-containing phosphohydrolase [Clostridium sp. 'White wine YQ']MDD7793053.1 CHASE4 domain-containing protein [Clostridium sp. 'White wine YQ']
MKVKQKTFSVVILSFIFMFLVTYAVFYLAYYGFIEKHKKNEIEESFQTVDYILSNEEENLKSSLLDWAVWDDTYEFINNKNDDYIKSNLDFSSLVTLNLKMMIFLDDKGNLVYSKETGIDKEVAEELSNEILLKNKEIKDIGSTKSPLLLVKNKAFLVAKSKVTKSDDSADSNGYLIFIREIDNKLLDYIQKTAKTSLTFNNISISEDKYYKDFKSLNNEVKYQKDKSSFEAYKVETDVYGEKTIMFSIETEQTDYQEYYFSIFVIGIILQILLVFVIDYIVIDKQIFKRLSKLTDFIEYVAKTKDTSLNIQLSGEDELNQLADSTNRMLMELNNAYKDIKESDKRFRIIMEATSDGYLDFYVKSREVYISPEWKEEIGYEGENGIELFKSYVSKIHPDCIDRLREKFYKVIKGEEDSFTEEFKIIKESGDIIWVSQRGKVSEKDSHGKPIRIVSTLSNITDRKKYEEEILYLSFTDKLTGIKNRAYMEKVFSELDSNEEAKYFIIMGDLNGLKLVNDSFGHTEGDKLIYAASKILREACSTHEIISRWGGDEFIIVIVDKDRSYISKLIDDIKIACLKETGYKFNISIALGYAEKNDEYPNTEAVMCLAEKRMYRNKLMEDKSSRNSTISSLLRTLHEKHSETEQHTMRIKKLSLKLGKRLGLSEDKLDELGLLALLHDIGKIGIPEQILMKPSSLTKEEFDIMKTHTEIGYRIAKSTPVLAHIADEILNHHEKYDGTGYPIGLKGEEIPLLARIINIVDSFDVMTHQRVYKEALSVEFAIEELKRCSGKQFDPYIVQEFIDLINEKKIY